MEGSIIEWSVCLWLNVTEQQVNNFNTGQYSMLNAQTNKHIGMSQYK